MIVWHATIMIGLRRILANMALGLVIIGLFEYRDTSFRTEGDITRVLSLPVLALVPMMESDIDHQVSRRRRRRVMISALVTVILLGSAAALTLWKL